MVKKDRVLEIACNGNAHLGNVMRSSAYLAYTTTDGREGLYFKKFQDKLSAYEFMKVQIRLGDWEKSMYVEDGKILIYDLWWLHGRPEDYKPWLEDLIKNYA